MGRASYDIARSFGDWPYAGLRSLVITSRELADAPPTVARVGADIPRLVTALRAAGGGKDTWIMGGAQTISAFLAAEAIDRLDLFTVPVLLGDGIPLFAPGRPETHLKLVSTQAYDKGLARQSYLRA
jgi:dihydrofolate reductase